MRDLSDWRQEVDQQRLILLRAWAKATIDLEAIAHANRRLAHLVAESPVNRIDGERRQQIDDALDGGKSIREIMESVRVAKGTVQAIRDERKAVGASNPPSANQVAIAIVTAARITGGDPIAVATGEVGTGGLYAKVAVSRARAYAAIAIRACFPENASPCIARWVGVLNKNSQSSYLANLDFQLKNKNLRWWDDGEFMRVVASIDSDATGICS